MVELLAFYQLQDGTVVQPVGKARGRVTLCAVETGETWGVRVDPFEERLDGGYIQRVRPEWQLVGDEAVEA